VHKGKEVEEEEEEKEEEEDTLNMRTEDKENSLMAIHCLNHSIAAAATVTAATAYSDKVDEGSHDDVMESSLELADQSSFSAVSLPVEGEEDCDDEANDDDDDNDKEELYIGKLLNPNTEEVLCQLGCLSHYKNRQQQ
jgi:hypothetical protein